MNHIRVVDTSSAKKQALAVRSVLESWFPRVAIVGLIRAANVKAQSRACSIRKALIVG
jgi:hypothetical protein